jgi:hypothetical protein
MGRQDQQDRRVPDEDRSLELVGQIALKAGGQGTTTSRAQVRPA